MGEDIFLRVIKPHTEVFENPWKEVEERVFGGIQLLSSASFENNYFRVIFIVGLG